MPVLLAFVLIIASSCGPYSSLDLERDEGTLWTSSVLFQIEPSWLYVNKDLRWESPPRKATASYRYSDNAELVVFYPTRQCALVSCTLYQRSRSQHESISMGDDFSVRKGTWSRVGDEITIKVRLTHGLRRENGRSNPREIEEVWRIRQRSRNRLAHSIERNGRIYVPAIGLESLGQLQAMIDDENLN
jgi:hypothetical protein